MKVLPPFATRIKANGWARPVDGPVALNTLVQCARAIAQTKNKRTAAFAPYNIAIRTTLLFQDILNQLAQALRTFTENTLSGPNQIALLEGSLFWYRRGWRCYFGSVWDTVIRHVVLHWDWVIYRRFRRRFCCVLLAKIPVNCFNWSHRLILSVGGIAHKNKWSHCKNQRILPLARATSSYQSQFF